MKNKTIILIVEDEPMTSKLAADVPKFELTWREERDKFYVTWREGGRLKG